MKISIIGLGYVGWSLSVLLSQKHDVISYDIDEKKINNINNFIYPFIDDEINNLLPEKKLNLLATTCKETAYEDSDFVIICTPTNYDDALESFDTSIVEKVIADSIKYNNTTNIVIKSTIPFGFTDKMKRTYNKDEIFFSPEFLREGKELYDNLYPSRIVVGDITAKAIKFGEILFECSKLSRDQVNIHYMTSSEAEAVKLFSNTYLAMRVAFFNELDTFSELNNFSSKKIISAISDDSRIGNYYNNPSFGYGGYCLPKDVRQLMANFKNIPSTLIKAIIESNETRKKHISNMILEKKPMSVGIYRLSMKDGSDNFRDSAILDIVNTLKKKNITIYIYEPLIEKSVIEGTIIENNIDNFISLSNLIVANRISNELNHVSSKVYTRDLFNEN